MTTDPPFDHLRHLLHERPEIVFGRRTRRDVQGRVAFDDQPAVFPVRMDGVHRASDSKSQKRRKAGLNEQNKSGEVDRTKVGTDGK